VSQNEFDDWVRAIRADGQSLANEDYLQLEKPSEREPVRRYSMVANGLYDAILNQCIHSPAVSDGKDHSC
jgi:cytochrome o ubiquinol oxidase subunit 2